MNRYQFMMEHDECHKLTSPKLTILTLVNGISTMDDYGERVVEIIMNEKRFDDIVRISENDMIDNGIYKKVIHDRKLLGASIVIDNATDENIIILNGERNDGMSVLKIYIGE